MIKTEPEVGDYMLKNNFSTFGREEDSVPVVKIDSISRMLGKKGGFGGKWLVNRAYQVNTGDFTIIDETEALRIMGIWENSTVLSPVVNDNVNTKCVREDTGKPKVTYEGRLGWRKPLFMFKMKNPDGGFQAYTCPECGNVHIGKTLTDTPPEQKPHINEVLNSLVDDELMIAVSNQLKWEKEGNANGYPWLRFNDATRKIYDEYIRPLEGEGFSAWFASYNLICREIAKRKFNGDI